jgi:hypothetical protein
MTALRHLVLLALVWLALPPATHAQLLPLRQQDGVFFPTAGGGLAVVALSVDARPDDEARLLGMLHHWRWDLEALIACRQVQTRIQPLAVVADTPPEQLRLWLDGARIPVQPHTLHRDPALPDHLYPRAARVDLPCAPGNLFTLRATWSQEAAIDTAGQYFLRLPTLATGLFDESIDTARIRITLQDRPVALQTTLGGYVSYDDPANQSHWTLRSWEPTRNFEISWMTPWTALQTIATVESCPPPRDIVQAMAAGNLQSLRTVLGAYDATTLRFCAGLPNVLRGGPIAADRTRQQLSDISMRRFLPALAQDSPFYRANPLWDERFHSDLERLYAGALQQILRELHTAAP